MGHHPGAREGSRDDFAEQITLHTEAMLRIAAALVGLADAEDAVQEAVLRGWQAWPTLRDPSAARPWLLSITVNLCRDWQRGRFGTRHRLDEPLRDDDHEAQAISLGSDPGGGEAAATLDLRQAVGTLDPDLRLVVALRHYAGMDSSEIGALLGISPVTVRTRLHRALTQLRERLSGPGTSSAPTPSLSSVEGGR
jgi:RNA polymerase sigma-70 factor (ECF subfamily)